MPWTVWSHLLNNHMTDLQREQHFWNRVNKDGDCWEWTGGTCKDGYGKTMYQKKHMKTHRVAFLLANGYLPPLVMHKCDNPPCCNPTHLSPGTVKDNVQDSLRKGRQDRKGEQSRNHKLKAGEVWLVRRLWDSGLLRQKDIAKMFRMTRSGIASITQGIRWTTE